MEEKKIVYEIIISIWNLAKEFDFKKLTDDEWEKFVNAGIELREKFVKEGKDIDLLTRGMFLALQNYYETKND